MRIFKDYFIPHEGNDLRPRFFHWETAVIVFSVALFLEILFLIQIYLILPATDYSANILPGVVVNLTNRSRETYDVPTLASNDLLSRAAQLKAEDMAAKGYFSHQGPGGETPWTWLDRVGYDYTSAGENLAVNFVESEDVVSAWMRSESHKENILSGRFTEIGIGVAKGIFEGREALFVVQFFGSPFSTPSKTSFAPPTGPVGKAPQAVQPAKTAGKAQEADAPAPASVPVASPRTAGAGTPPASASLGFLREFFSLPHRMVNYLYAMMFTMIALAFSLMVFIRIRVQHPRLILNGAMMLLVVGSLMVFNHYFLLSQVKVL